MRQLLVCTTLIATVYWSTAHMVRVARSLLPLYPQVDADAIAGIILHDIGKLEEYIGEFAANEPYRYARGRHLWLPHCT